MVEGDGCRQCLVSRRFWVAMAMLLMEKLTPGSEKWYFDDEKVKTNFRRTWAGSRKLTLRTPSKRGHFFFCFSCSFLLILWLSVISRLRSKACLEGNLFCEGLAHYFFRWRFSENTEKSYLLLSVTLRTLLRPTKSVGIAVGYHGAPDFISVFLISAGS